MSEEEKGFVVKDRRIFTDEDKDAEANDKKEQTHPATEEQAPSPPETEKSPEPEAPEPSKTDASEEQPQLPEINFPTFIVSLNASALLHLGAIEDPTTGQKTKMTARTVTMSADKDGTRRFWFIAVKILFKAKAL